MLKGENIFAKVKNENEKRLAFENLYKNKSEFIGKSVQNGGEVFKILPVQMGFNKLKCQLIKPFTELKPEKVIVQFLSSGEKYLIQTTCQWDGDFLSLDLTADLYKLHRRNDFRVLIPKRLHAKLVITSVNDKVLTEQQIIPELNLLDLSAGGCRVETLNREFKLKSNDRIDCQLQIQNRDSIKLKAIARHGTPHPDLFDTTMIGIEFVGFPEAPKDKLLSLVLDLYREVSGIS